MNLPQIFLYQGTQVRTVIIDGEPWWVLKDLCEILELDQVAGVKRRLSDDVISNHPIPDSLGRQQDTTIINEDGLYDVILESRKTEAKAFRKWITGEVIPSIRQTGSYSMTPQLPRSYKEALIAHSEAILALAAEVDKNEELTLDNKHKTEQLKEQAPKVAMYQMLIAADNTQPIGTIAKAVGMGRNTLFNFLREKGLLMKNSTLPYQKYVDQELFVVKEVPTQRGDKTVNEAVTRVTPKGLEYITKLVKGASA